MQRRLVRKWKVKSAAWAGVTAVLVGGPASYVLLRSSDEGVRPPTGAVRTHVLAGPPEAPAGTMSGTRVSSPSQAKPKPRGPTDLAALERVARSNEVSPLERARAVAQIGQFPGAEALMLLEVLAREGRDGEEPNLVSLAAINGLWARGERDLVREIAAASPDPAVKSKALALARAKSH